MIKKQVAKIFPSVIIYIILCNVLLVSNSCASTLKEWIAEQTTIRVTADDGPGFGDQAAIFNIIRWLREKEEYKNNIQLIYGYGNDTKNKIITLFNLPSTIPDDYDDETDKIRFIKADTYITLHKNKQIDNVALGITSGHSDFLCQNYDVGYVATNNYEGLTPLECINFANFYDTDVFVKIDLFPYTASRDAGRVYLKNQLEQWHPALHPVNIKNTYFPEFVPDIVQAQKLAQQDSSLLTQLPGLLNFINGMIKQDFDVLPVYAYPILPSHDVSEPLYVGNMLQIITAARYAQLHGRASNKPLIIAVFYNYDEEIKKLYEIIHDDNWGALRDDPAIEQVKTAIKQLGLTDIFSIASLTDTSLLDPKTKELPLQFKKPGQIILLSIGSSLPKDIFDGLYTHTGDNIWPQIREGANSFNSLVMTGKPHFRCAFIGWPGAPIWEIGYDLITDSVLKKQLEDLYGREDEQILNQEPEKGSSSSPPGSQFHFGSGMHSWGSATPPTPIYQTLGKLFVSAAYPDSALSQYFQLLKTNASDPENDRISRTLEFGFQLSHQ